MRIAFLLPNHSGNIVGSLRTFYGLAGELRRHGHQIDLIHPAINAEIRAPLKVALAKIWSIRQNLRRNPVPWQSFLPGIRPVFAPRLSSVALDHDVAVGFTWRGMEALARSSFRGARFGYVVEYETWAEAAPSLRARMESAYRSGPPVLSCSGIVDQMLGNVGVVDVRSCVLGANVERFRSSTPPSQRPIRIGFPVRTEPVKSPEVLLSALELVRRKAREPIHLWGFGNSDAPSAIVGLLDEYHIQPDDDRLASLFARTAIFAVPSRKEGFGLPAAEAMAAGCALVSADNGGIRTFGHDGIDCRIVPPNDPTSLADAILDLVEHPKQRIEVATRAVDAVSFLSWELAGERLVSALGLRGET